MWKKIASLVLRNRVIFLHIVGLITAFMENSLQKLLKLQLLNTMRLKKEILLKKSKQITI